MVTCGVIRSYHFSGNIQPHCLVLDDNICKREKCLKKLVHTPTHDNFSLICHSEKDFTRTNTTAVQVGRMSWLVATTNTSSQKRRIFSVSTGLKCLVDRNPFFNENRCHKNSHHDTWVQKLHSKYIFGGFRWCRWDGSWGEVSVNQLSEIKPSTHIPNSFHPFFVGNSSLL